ncbi:phosphatidylethanolamine-binding protein 4 [Pholidichthys leucotaenia]
MAALALFLVCFVGVLGIFHVEATQENLSPQDASFCHGELEVIYPQLDIDTCLIIQKKFRKKVTTVWKAPKVHFPGAKKNKRYVLMMVDPDAPSRTNPTHAYWRHWLVVNIQGPDLKEGHLQGITLTDYYPPTPPHESGFHRYQFKLFEQPPDASVSLTEKEKHSRGKWDVDAFVKKFHLGKPVATLQFLTQNYED